jgi:hypothetical protein
MRAHNLEEFVYYFVIIRCRGNVCQSHGKALTFTSVSVAAKTRARDLFSSNELLLFSGVMSQYKYST